VRRRAPAGWCALACVIALTGCASTGAPSSTPRASTQSQYSSDVAARLQSEVLSVTSAAAAGDPATALARLDELSAVLADAKANNQVTAARFLSVSASIDLVRGDLETAVAAQIAQDNPVKSTKPGKSGTHGKNG
jgi:hypothetical protein